MARGVSTVVDVSVCLLLVGAAVATLTVGVPQAGGSEPPEADTTATKVATVTATVPAADDRKAHDTLAGHLATAAITNSTLAGDPLVKTQYPDATRDETADQLDDRVFVTARWEPYPDARLSGRLVAGEQPPSNADIAATRLTVDSGITIGGEQDGFEGMAAALAESYVAWLFPPERTYARLTDARTAPEAADRYRAIARTLGVDVNESVTGAEPRIANQKLADAFAESLEADLRERYETPEQAVSDTTADEVRIVVRRWEP